MRDSFPGRSLIEVIKSQQKSVVGLLLRVIITALLKTAEKLNPEP